MAIEGYQKKLEQFNKSANYRSEYELLRGLIGNEKGQIVDYGCGTGFLVDKFSNDNLSVLGYDANDYWDEQYPIWMKTKNLSFTFNTVYFMHSISHVPNLAEVLKTLYQRISDGGRIIVITPNPNWIKFFNHLYKIKDYKPDPTVIKHLNREELFQAMNSAGFLEISCGQVGSECSGQHERLFGVYQRKFV